MSKKKKKTRNTFDLQFVPILLIKIFTIKISWKNDFDTLS